MNRCGDSLILAMNFSGGFFFSRVWIEGGHCAVI